MALLKSNESILGDSGFAGVEHHSILSSIVSETILMELKYRIVVENAISEIKNWKIQFVQFD